MKFAGKAASKLVDMERSSSPSQQGSTPNPTGNQEDDDAYLDGYYTGDNGSTRSGIINGGALLKSVTSGSYSSDGEPSLKSPDQQFPAQMGFGSDPIINQPILSKLQGIETNLQQSIGNVQMGFGPDAIINQPILSDLRGIETNLQQSIGNAGSDLRGIETNLQQSIGNAGSDLRGIETNLQQSIGNAASGLATWKPDTEDLKHMGDGLKLGMKVMSHVHIPGGHHKGRNGGLRSRLASMVNGKGGEKSHSPSTDTHEGQNEV